MNGDRQLATPDITTAQIIAVVGAVIALAVAFGLDISQEKQDAIRNLVLVLAPVLIAADGLIRHGRSRAMIMPPKGETATTPRATTRRASSTTGARRGRAR
jgi:hypothetical protein